MVEQQRYWLPQARRAVFEVYRRQASSTWIEARGNSMRPLIAPGTWMLVEFGAAPPAPGEIVLFSLGELLVAHRVVSRCWRQDTALLIAKGDAEPYYDPPLRLSDVIGVVRALRYGPDGPVIGVGCAGRPARLIAQISYWSGRGAGLGRRAAALLPNPLRRMALRVIALCIWAAAQALLAPVCWAAWIQVVRLRTQKRGK